MYFTGRDRIDDLKLMIEYYKQLEKEYFEVSYKMEDFEQLVKDIEDDLDELDELRNVEDKLFDFEEFAKIFKDRIELFHTNDLGFPTYGFVIGFDAYYVSKEQYELMEKIFKEMK